MAEHEPRIEILPPGPGDGPAPPELTETERNWAMLCHLSALVGYAFPFGHILGPLAVWLFKGEAYPLVNDQGREALNFQLSMTIYYIAAGLLVFIVIGIPLLGVLVIFHLIVMIVAAVKAKSGERYRYPFTIRFIR